MEKLAEQNVFNNISYLFVHIYNLLIQNLIYFHLHFPNNVSRKKQTRNTPTFFHDHNFPRRILVNNDN